MINDLLAPAPGIIAITTSAVGYGSLVGKVLRVPGNNLAGDGVVGVAILTTISMAAHFFIPLQQPVNLLIVLPGVLSFLLLFRRTRWYEVLLLAVMVWWALCLSVTGRLPYDHGLYHLQSVLWNGTFRAIPGLANIHMRLGFNSALFVFAAASNIPVLGGLFLSFLSGALLQGMLAGDLLLSIRSSKERLARVYSLIVVLFFLVRPRWFLEQSYLSPDPVIVLGILYIVLLFLDKRLPALLISAAFLVTLKLSAMPLLLLPDLKLSRQKGRAPLLIGVCIVCIWLARNIVLSGYLLFPVAPTRVPVEWAVPKEEARQTAEWITSWARQRDRTPAGTRGVGWIMPWSRRTFSDRRLWLVALSIFMGGLLLVWRGALPEVNLWLIGTCLAGLSYWFVAAPDLRFGIGFFFALGYVVLAYGVRELPWLRLESRESSFIVGFLAIGLSASAFRQVGPPWPASETPTVRLTVTPTGKKVWTPTVGDQCWSVIPCSPEPAAINYFPERAQSMIHE